MLARVNFSTKELAERLRGVSRAIRALRKPLHGVFAGDGESAITSPPRGR